MNHQRTNGDRNVRIHGPELASSANSPGSTVPDPKAIDQSEEDTQGEADEEFAALLATTADEPPIEDEGPESSRSPSFLRLPEPPANEDADDEQLAPLELSAAVATLAEAEEKDDSDGPNGTFLFELRAFRHDVQDEGHEEPPDHVALEPLPELDQDDGVEAALDVGSVAFSDAVAAVAEETRFGLLTTIAGSFSALCLTPSGVVAAESLREI